MIRAWGLAFVALLVLGWLVTPVLADQVHTWGSQFYASTIRLQPTSAPGAVAEVEFINKTVHRDENVTFTLDLDGMAVVIDASVGRGLRPDRMTVTPRIGYIAVPPEIYVPEDETGVVLIYRGDYVGM